MMIGNALAEMCDDDDDHDFDISEKWSFGEPMQIHSIDDTMHHRHPETTVREVLANDRWIREEPDLSLRNLNRSGTCTFDIDGIVFHDPENFRYDEKLRTVVDGGMIAVGETLARGDDLL